MHSNSPRILIVDDEPDTCANLSDILNDLGYTVDTAYDGFAALELARKNSYEVALLDLRMPGMDGLELYRRLREISAETVAIVVTAYASSDTAKSVLDSGAWKILPKPVNIGDLLKDVSHALDTPLVLVVDDDCDLCENLWEILHERGFRVCLANDLPQAEKKLAEHRFQVVLIDMKLPSGTGQELLHTLRTIDPDARTVIITGFRNEMETKVQTAMDAGANAVCYKPFDVAKLISTVEALSERRSTST
jgi:two-component system, NtrC family, response regulator HydG